MAWHFQRPQAQFQRDFYLRDLNCWKMALTMKTVTRVETETSFMRISVFIFLNPRWAISLPCSETDMPCLQPGLVLTLLWLLLLIQVPGKEQSDIPPKAVLLLDPPWSTTFEGQTVTLTCKNYPLPAQGSISWYQNRKSIKKTSEEIIIKKSGYYQCKTQESSLSDPVHVEFSSDRLILQAPHPVFEGDNVTLRCQMKKDEKMFEKIYYKNGKQLHDGYNSDSITLNSVSRDHDEYKCIASRNIILGFLKTETSKPLRIQVQELFTYPVLTASPSKPIEGGPLILTCEAQLHVQRSYVQLQFCFFRNSQPLGSGWSSSPKLQIPTIWREDSGNYWCKVEALTHRITKRSLMHKIYVQRVPVSDVNLEIQPPGGQLIEGENLVLICSVARGTGTITFSWHKEGTVSLGRKTQRSLLAELQVPTVKEHDAGRYYCAADNNHVPILSRWITVTVRSLVSQPVLTLRTPRAQTALGDMMELHCEALRGSPPILYQFYHENVTLGNISAPSGGGASFNFSLTAEHSGNYFCEANNGLGAQRSHRVSLQVTVPVSRPVLTLRASKTQLVVGNMMELHCEALRGSPPILYQLYRENVILGNIWAPSGGGATFKLSLTAEHFGSYSCDANNSLGAQHSEVMTINISDPKPLEVELKNISPVSGNSRKRTVLITVGVLGGFLGILFFAATQLYCIKTQRKSGGPSATETPSYNPNEYQEPSSSRLYSIDPQEPSHPEQLAQMELQPVYSNVNPRDSNVIYSQIQSIQHTKGISGNSPWMYQNNKEPAVIYSELKKAHPDDSAGQASSRGSAHEDATENYENVPCAPAASDH